MLVLMASMMMVHGLGMGALVQSARLLQESCNFEHEPAPFASPSGGPRSHWLIEDRLMIGRTPADRRALEDAGIDCFVSVDEVSTGDDLHLPIASRRTPEIDACLEVLDACLSHFATGGNAIYVHSSGGRCRPALVGSCLVTLLREEDDAGPAAVADALEALGQEALPLLQRRFVASIGSSITTHRRLLSDQAMVDAGMPRGYM